ncbi:MAG: hypothetical protein EZS28_054107, partial [Streblomastix strix]
MPLSADPFIYPQQPANAFGQQKLNTSLFGYPQQPANPFRPSVINQSPFVQPQQPANPFGMPQQQNIPFPLIWPYSNPHLDQHSPAIQSNHANPFAFSSSTSDRNMFDLQSQQQQTNVQLPPLKEDSSEQSNNFGAPNPEQHFGSFGQQQQRIQIGQPQQKGGLLNEPNQPHHFGAFENPLQKQGSTFGQTMA